MGLRAEQLKGFNEKAPDWYERRWSDKSEVYLHLMESVVFEAARLGEGVIIGHGSQVLLHDFGCALHVLVTAQEESLSSGDGFPSCRPEGRDAGEGGRAYFRRALQT